jgi:hypothetical protein
VAGTGPGFARDRKAESLPKGGCRDVFVQARIEIRESLR